jgi:hypothetical protein
VAHRLPVRLGAHNHADKGLHREELYLSGYADYRC